MPVQGVGVAEHFGTRCPTTPRDMSPPPGQAEEVDILKEFALHVPLKKWRGNRDALITDAMVVLKDWNKLSDPEELASIEMKNMMWPNDTPAAVRGFLSKLVEAAKAEFPVSDTEPDEPANGNEKEKASDPKGARNCFDTVSYVAHVFIVQAASSKKPL